MSITLANRKWHAEAKLVWSRPLPPPEGKGPRTVPPPCRYDTPGMELDATGSKLREGAKVVWIDGQGYAYAEPTPEARAVTPTKAEYIAAFQAEAEAEGKPLPACVERRRASVFGLVAAYKRLRRELPTKARKPLDRMDANDLACVYDRGLKGRMIHYCEKHFKAALAAQFGPTL